MIGLGTLKKLASGGLGPDEIREILAQAGMDFEFASVPVVREGFTALALSASLPGSKVVQISGRMKDGQRIHALMVLSDAAPKKSG